jgi:hypothetical protein
VTVQLEVKSADAAEVKGGGALATDDPMVFSIIGSVTGIIDEVNDIVEPGAYSDTLRRRNPKIIKDHDWQQRLGKTLEHEEYFPGDPRLPKVTADGKPWPREAGALVCKVRLFNSEEGRNAAERWREYGSEQQYSIGYVVPQGKASKDPKTGVRRIKSLDLFEISDVLWGAMPLAGPMPSALATKMLPAVLGAEAADEDDDDPADEPEVKDLPIEALDEDVQAELPGLLESPPEAKYDTSPIGTPGGRQNWVDKAGGLPSFIRAIAHALIRHGASVQRAIATAVAACKRWAAGGGNVSAKTRAKAAAAVAEWERKHTTGKDLGEDAAQGGQFEDLFGYDPALEGKASPVALESRGTPRLPGTLEERRDLVVAAVKARLDGNTMVVGTADDHVVASRLLLNDEGEPTDVESYRIDYTLRGGLVHLEEPQPVTLTLQTSDGDVAEEDIHLADVVEDAVISAKTLLLPGVEGKAGRVLSGGNTERVKNAVQALIAVLKVAGVDLDPKNDDAPAAPAAPPAASAPPVVQAKSFDLGDLPDPSDLVASLRAAARGE